MPRGIPIQYLPFLLRPSITRVPLASRFTGTQSNAQTLSSETSDDITPSEAESHEEIRAKTAEPAGIKTEAKDGDGDGDGDPAATNPEEMVFRRIYRRYKDLRPSGSPRPGWNVNNKMIMQRQFFRFAPSKIQPKE